jgi:hypothetical protein
MEGTAVTLFVLTRHVVGVSVPLAGGHSYVQVTRFQEIRKKEAAENSCAEEAGEARQEEQAAYISLRLKNHGAPNGFAKVGLSAGVTRER